MTDITSLTELLRNARAVLAEKDAEIARLRTDVEDRDTALQLNKEECDHWAAETARLRREKAELAEASEDLLNDKQYLQFRADYNRGHLSHCNWLNERERKYRAALRSATETNT